MKDNLDNFNNECLKADLSEISLAAASNFPDKCGLGIIDSTKIADASESNLETPDVAKASVYCAACQPGYKESKSASLLFYVYACTVIQNCEKFGSAFGQCDECKPDYAFKYTSADGVDYSQCISSDVNCYAHDSDNGKCKFCKNGFSLNIDNKCEAFIAPHCELN